MPKKLKLHNPETGEIMIGFELPDGPSVDDLARLKLNLWLLGKLLKVITEEVNDDIRSEKTEDAFPRYVRGYEISRGGGGEVTRLATKRIRAEQPELCAPYLYTSHDKEKVLVKKVKPLPKGKGKR